MVNTLRYQHQVKTAPWLLSSADDDPEDFSHVKEFAWLSLSRATHLCVLLDVP